MSLAKLFTIFLWGGSDKTPQSNHALPSQQRPKTAPLADKIRKMANNPEEVMKYKRYQVTAEEVSEWLHCFADGIQYVYEKYGHSPRDFQVYDRIQHDKDHLTAKKAIGFDTISNRILVTRCFISDAIRNMRLTDMTFKNWNTKDRDDFTYKELTTLIGVEEAYHSYQRNCLPHVYTHRDWKRTCSVSTEFEYAACPIESDASIAILAAANELSLGRNYIGECKKHNHATLAA